MSQALCSRGVDCRITDTRGLSRPLPPRRARARSGSNAQRDSLHRKMLEARSCSARARLAKKKFKRPYSCSYRYYVVRAFLNGQGHLTPHPIHRISALQKESQHKSSGELKSWEVVLLP